MLVLVLADCGRWYLCGVGGGVGQRSMCELAKRDTFISLRLNRKIIINIIATTLLGQSLACLRSGLWNGISASLFLARPGPSPGFDLPALAGKLYIYFARFLYRLHV